MKDILWIFAVCGVVGLIESSHNPGFQARITAKGLNYGAHVAIDVLTNIIHTQNIPDQHGKEHHLEYSVTGIHVKGFTKPQTNLAPQSGRGLTWQATGLGLSVHTDFHYKYRKIFHISGHGSIDASVSSTSFTLSVAMGRDTSGRPNITASGCNCNIGHFSLKFHGGASRLYNLLKGLFKKFIKKQIQKVVCNSAEAAIRGAAAKALSKLPVTIDIGHKFLLDYRLLSPPRFTATYMDTLHKGEMFWSSRISETPFPAPSVPALTGTSKMVYLGVSDYLINSLCYVAYHNGVLKAKFTNKDLPHNERFLLNATCPKSLVDICLGQIIPQIGNKYPNSLVELRMAATHPPKMTISPAGISLDFTGVISFFAHAPNGHYHLLFSVSVGLGTTLRASVKNEKIHGVIEKLAVGVHMTKSEIGNVETHKLQGVINSAITLFVKPVLNTLGSRGFPLPVTGQVTFANTELRTAKDFLILGTDVHYSPK